MSRRLFHALSLLAFVGTALPVMAAEQPSLRSPEGGWAQDGVRGAYDRAALQRGFQVYKQICANCHGMKHVAYRNLAGIGLTEDAIKAVAAEYKVTDGPNDQGEMVQRPARPSDAFVSPFANDAAARVAMNGALPPDLSLIVKAREGHEDYIYSLLTGFGQQPQGNETLAAGMNYNPYFPGHQIAMPPPLSDGAVTYTDGTKATLDQEARDVVQFLAWAGDPHMETRKHTGFGVLAFLAVFAGLMYAVKRRVWGRLR